MTNKEAWKESIESYRKAQFSLKPNKYQADSILFQWIERRIQQLLQG